LIEDLLEELSRACGAQIEYLPGSLAKILNEEILEDTSALPNHV
jgi:hypothetical protein